MVVCWTRCRPLLRAQTDGLGGWGCAPAASGLLLPSLPDYVPPLSGGCVPYHWMGSIPFGRGCTPPPPPLSYPRPCPLPPTHPGLAVATTLLVGGGEVGRRGPWMASMCPRLLHPPPSTRWLPQSSGESETWRTCGDCLSAASRRAGLGSTPQLSLEKENKMSQWLLNGRAAEPASRSGCVGSWPPQRWGWPAPGPCSPDVKWCARWPRMAPLGPPLCLLPPQKASGHWPASSLVPGSNCA